MLRRLWWLLWLWGQALAFSAQAGVVHLSPGVESHALNPAAEVLEDASGRLTLADVSTGPAARRFQPAHPGLSSFGFTDSAFWFRIELDNPSDQPRPMVLVLRTPWLDTVELFSPQAGGGFQAQKLGDTQPFAQRLHANPQFVIDMQVAPGRHTHYLRLSSSQAFMTPIELWTPEAFQGNARQWSAYFGMFYGVVLVMVLYNGLIWLSTRDRNYALCCLYLLAFFWMNLAYNGFSFQYLWPDAPRWSNWSHTPWIFLYQVSAVLLAMTFLESRTRVPRMHRLLQILLGAMLACWAAVTAFAPPVVYHAAPVYFIFVSTPLIVATGVAAWRSGYHAARFFMLASMSSLVGSFCTALTASGGLPYNFATFHAAEFGIMLGVVLLSLALADRINLLRQQREEAEQSVLQQKLRSHALLAQANEDLERTVQERTAELARARDEAERLARTDMLTGVANRRYFEEVAAREVARAQRYQQPLSLVLFDIDLFKLINDQHGHAAGDAVIRTAARVVTDELREVDFVARIGGEEFAILLPTIPLEPALVTAERLRERIANSVLAHNSTSLAFTASLGVSQLGPNDTGFGALLHRADQAMYAAKQAGRNRVAGLAPEPAATASVIAPAQADARVH